MSGERADRDAALPAAPAQDLTFGESMEKLAAIVAQLEGSDDLGLEQAMALYEQAQALAADCEQRLSAATLRLTEIGLPSDPEA